MVTKLLSASAILTVAGMASGATFGVNTVDAGGVSGGLGAAITWSGGAAFGQSAGSNNPPDQAAAGGNSTFLDSYIAIDTDGPSRPNTSSSNPDGYTAQGPTGLVATGLSPAGQIFQASSLVGVWFNQNGFVNSGADERLFIAQITLRAASVTAGGLSTTGLLVNIKDNKPGQSSDGELGALKFGLANATNNGNKWGQSYYLEAVGRAVTGVNATFNGGLAYAVYIVTVPVPAPGAAGIAGLAGLVALRRRR